MTLSELKKTINALPDYTEGDKVKVRIHPRHFSGLWEAALKRCPDKGDYDEFDILDALTEPGSRAFIIEI